MFPKIFHILFSVVISAAWLWQVVAGRMGLLITILLCLVNIFNVVNNNSPSVKVTAALVSARLIHKLSEYCTVMSTRVFTGLHI